MTKWLLFHPASLQVEMRAQFDVPIQIENGQVCSVRLVWTLVASITALCLHSPESLHTLSTFRPSDIFIVRNRLILFATDYIT